MSIKHNINLGITGSVSVTDCNLRIFILLYYNMVEINNELLDFCIKELEKIDKEWIKRNRKINTLSIFYHLYNSSITNIGISSSIKLYDNFSHTALINARKKLPTDTFYNLNKIINNQKCIKNNIENYIYAIDGSKIRVFNGFIKNGYRTIQKKLNKSNNRNSRGPQCLLSVLQGIQTNTIVNYAITKTLNERSPIKFLIKDLKKNSIVILDRGYYSKNIYNLFISSQIHCIMRLKYDANKKVENFYNSNKTNDIIDIICNSNIIKMRLIKYEIDSIKYIIGTSLMNESLNYIKELYHKRWNIELTFKRLKSHLNINKIHSRTEELWLQEIQFRIVLDSMLYSIQTNHIIKNKKNKVKYIYTYVYLINLINIKIYNIYTNYHQFIT